MDDWNDDDDESMDESMQEPVAKRAKRGRDGAPTHVDIETENVKARLDALKVADDSSDDDFPMRGDGDNDMNTSEVKDAKRMVMNSAKKVKERARRGKMADSVRSLRSLVPGCADEKKVNQSQVLANTVTYITKVQVQMAQLQRELESLKSQVSAPQSRTEGDQSSSSKGFSFAPAKNSSLSSRQRQSSNSRNAGLASGSFASNTAPMQSAIDTKTSFSRPVLKLTTASNPSSRVRGNRGTLGAPIAIDPVSPPAPPASDASSQASPDTKPTTVPLFGAHSTSPSSYHMSPFVPFVPFFTAKSDPASIKSSSTPTSASPMLDHSLQAPSTPHGFGLTSNEMPPLGASPLTNNSYMTHYGFTGEDLGPELPAEWQTPGITQIPNAPSRSDPDMYDDPSMLMDDIEDVGSWPLYHANAAGSSGVFDPYTATSSSTMPGAAPTPTSSQPIDALAYATQTLPNPPHHHQHQHHLHQRENSAQSQQDQIKNLCECGERPVY